jgi:hypothetical protein
VFFNELGLKYDYETEGFDLNGTKYLPDFWLPAPIESWFEVKPSNYDPDDISEDEDWFKAHQLCKYSKKDVLIARGPPVYSGDGRHQISWFYNVPYWRNGKHGVVECYGDSWRRVIELQFVSATSGDLGLWRHGFDWLPKCWQHTSCSLEAINRAYERAAYARFEHGASG